MIDSHAHIHDTQFESDRDAVIARFFAKGGEAIVTIGTNEKTSKRAISLAKAYEHIYATIALHPLHLFDAYPSEDEEVVEEFDKAKYRALASDDNVVAIGEVGLDYHHFSDTHNIAEIKELQKAVFVDFIAIANEVEKPLVIHCWDGYDDLLKILHEYPVEKKGVIHSFIGSWKTAQKFINLGFVIGLNGIVTYGESYDKLMRNIDINDVLIETDCPFLPPRPLPRDRRCEPSDVRYVAQKIADVKDIAIDTVIAATARNTKRIFGINVK